MSDSQSRWRAWHYWMLWLVALTSIILNALIISSLLAFRSRAQTAVADARQHLAQVEIDDFALPVNVDETLPLSLTVAYSDTFQVPIQATIPVSTSVTYQDQIAVPINDVVSINRNVTVSIIVLGQRIPVEIPIRADIPISLDVSVPINAEIPVQTEIPVDLEIEVPIESTIPVETSIPVSLDFPVTIPLGEMGVGELIQQGIEGLNALEEVIGRPR